ncbi:MAG: hypothetical protein A2Y62_13305 [Candidatus Fischerbacteria bacterium RBG_13_37_8]|uniref:Thioredoxin domain-containing protein n=1 Tax=Candidatus Fischerbacteria bacterium RBG_13_37_8 TaxID=1817863 RepID=A0A1F5VPD4_9BACT|nr:MAG: hypothetical protein A2Y62_13305 [Candidatus Fischerbacteria bacterium RBG_13_37_8]
MNINKLMILSVVFILAISVACKKEQADQVTVIPTKETATEAMEMIKSLNPNWGPVAFEFDKIEPSPMPDLYQARFYVDQQGKKIPIVIYLKTDGKHILLGQIYDGQAKKNLTADFAGDVKETPVDISKINLNNGAIKGDLNAPVKIIEYSDFQCPFCKRAIPIIDQIIKDYGKDVVLIFKNLPLPMHNLATPMAIAAECGAEQRADAFWNFHDAFFSESFTITEEAALKTRVTEIAKEAKLDIAKFTDCYTNKKTEARVQSQSNEAMAVGVNSTPTFIINGEKVSGAVPYENFKAIIDAKLK